MDMKNQKERNITGSFVENRKIGKELTFSRSNGLMCQIL